MVWLTGNAYNGTQQLARALPITNMTHQGLNKQLPSTKPQKALTQPNACSLDKIQFVFIRKIE
jgi:hypothetical protein